MFDIQHHCNVSYSSHNLRNVQSPTVLESHFTRVSGLSTYNTLKEQFSNETQTLSCSLSNVLCFTLQIITHPLDTTSSYYNNIVMIFYRGEFAVYDAKLFSNR